MLTYQKKNNSLKAVSKNKPAYKIKDFFKKGKLIKIPLLIFVLVVIWLGARHIYDLVRFSTWETYRNEGLGFEMKYPKGFDIKELRDQYAGDKIYFSRESEDGVYVFINNSKYKNFKDYKENFEFYSGMLEDYIFPIRIDGESILVARYQSMRTFEKERTITAVHRNKFYKIDTSKDSFFLKDRGYKAFKFIE